MIRRIRGEVLSIGSHEAVIDVSGFGVGISLADTSTLTEGETATLHTFLSFKQDGVELYGFVHEDDLSFFELLNTVSGVGPKTALSILRRAPREALRTAIASRDITYLTRVAGLGKKASEKLAIELSEKIGATEAVIDDEDTEVFDTLVALGYTEREARKAMGSIPDSLSGKEARLKAALAAH